jgi:signal transduction histidine kinase
LHGGRLELQSQAGLGTIVIAWLPDWRRSEADQQARFGAV